MIEQTSARSFTRPGPFHVPLRVTFSWTLLGYFAYAGCQWGTIVALAKLGTPEMVGQYALGLTVTAPVILFCSLQLRNVQVTDAKGEYAFGDYLGVRLVTSLLAMLLVAAIVTAGHFSPRTGSVILTIGIVKAIDAIADTYAGLFQQHDRMDRVAISQVLRGFSALAALVAAIWSTHDLLTGVLAMTSTSILLLFLYDIPSGRVVSEHQRARGEAGGTGVLSLRPRWHPPTMIALVRLGLPLGVLILLLSLNSNVPSYVIGRLLGQAQLGLFAALAFLTLVGLTIVNALGQSASRRLARAFTAGDRRAFRTLTFRLLLMALALNLAGTVVAVVAGRPLLAMFYTPEYAEQNALFVHLMAAVSLASVASVLGVALTATRCFAPQVPLGIGVTALTLGTCRWLVPISGLHGAAWGILISYAVQSAGLAVLLARRLADLPRVRSGDPWARGGDAADHDVSGRPVNLARTSQ